MDGSHTHVHRRAPKAAAITDAQEDLRAYGQTILSLKGKAPSACVRGCAKALGGGEPGRWHLESAYRALGCAVGGTRSARRCHIGQRASPRVMPWLGAPTGAALQVDPPWPQVVSTRARARRGDAFPCVGTTDAVAEAHARL